LISDLSYNNAKFRKVSAEADDRYGGARGNIGENDAEKER